MNIYVIYIIWFIYIVNIVPSIMYMYTCNENMTYSKYFLKG